MLLYLQCPTGISGDMFLAGLADLGLDLQPLQTIMQKTGFKLQLEAKKEHCQGLHGSRLMLEFDAEQPLRTLPEMTAVLHSLEVSAAVRDKTCQALERLANVEAEVHGIPVEQVHFHEVGAVDTLVDLLGAFWGLEQLGIEHVYCSPLPWFRGEVSCAHGLLPLPAPAVLRLLQGKPVYPTQFTQELITPTGCLLVDQIVQEFTPGPTGQIASAGTGWGSKKLGDMPNGLRMILFQGQSQSKDEEYIWILESNVDHLTGEELGAVFEPMFAAGALDVLYLPGIMKKNRSGGLLKVLCQNQDVHSVRDEFFRQTLTLGIREYQVRRTLLERQKSSRDTPWGPLQTKQIKWQGQSFERAEYEALLKLAEKTGRSVVQLRYMLWGS